jgi:hypothetical protein
MSKLIRMESRLVIFFSVIFISTALTAQTNSFFHRTDFWHDFEGEIGKNKIDLSLYLFKNGEVKGSYIMNNSEHKIPVFGYMREDSLIIKDTSSNEKMTIISTMKDSVNDNDFSGYCFVGRNRFNFNVENRTRTGGTFKNRYKPGVYYGEDSEIELFAKQIKKALINKDREWVSNHVKYPITINLGNSKKVIATKLSLLSYYDRIFNEPFISIIKDCPTVNLFVNSQGVMFAHGKIWIINTPNSNKDKYSFCIKAIN